jgi:hypothetical protein
MKTIIIAEFTRHFTRHKNTPCLVKDRNKVVGKWELIAQEPPAVDFMARLNKDFPAPLPITAAQILKERRTR